jgi:aminoglycoside phosphotransferase family enzyme/predicted kinase
MIHLNAGAGHLCKDAQADLAFDQFAAAAYAHTMMNALAPQAALIQALCQQMGARLIETHISWVLLDGVHAWKIKKPVRLPFLDASALSTRLRLCRQELALNRRLAPQLYLGVHAITGTPDAPHMQMAVFEQANEQAHEQARAPAHGQGEPIEYALCMRQFPTGALMTEQLQAGTLLPKHIDQLALRLARFHEGAAVAPNDAPEGYGSPAVIEAATRGVLAGLRQQGGEGIAVACTRLEAWLCAEAVRLRPVWLRRLAEGHVREGHGDLHLANLIVLADEVTAFDCIEFDPALRWADQLFDIAFLVMDLMAHGRSDLAWRFFNAYLDQTGDHAGLPVLRYALVYRALVRAMVAGLPGAQHDVGGEFEQRASKPGYLGLALRLIEGAPPQGTQARLLITHGVSGSGKSFVSLGLIEQAGAIRLRADVLRKRLAGLPPLGVSRAASHAEAQGLYSPQATQRTYASLMALAAMALREGYPVVVDATFLRLADRDAFRELAQGLQLAFAIVHCHAPDAVLQARVSARRARADDASEADLSVLAAQQAHHEPLLDREQPFVLHVDTSQPVDAGALAHQWFARTC